MTFQELSRYFEEIEKTASRLSITHLLADLFTKLNPEELQSTVYLLQGRVVPLYEKIEFGMAEKMVSRSVLHALQLDSVDFAKQLGQIGDLGKTTEHFKREIISFEEKPLPVYEVYKELYRMATLNGAGSQDTKMKILAHLISQLDALACRYIVRIPIGAMRLGFSDMTVLDAYSWMVGGDKQYRPLIEKAYHVRPDLGHIGRLIKEEGIQALEAIQPTLFTPIIMMRAERLSSAEEIIEKIGECIIEPKYDGFRLQVHYRRATGEVKLFSRNLEEVSEMYPDLIEGVRKEVNANEIIFEGEALGFDPNARTFLPFQETVQRKRKYGIEEKAKEIPLKIFAFEMLYLDGKSYLTIPCSERRRTMEEYLVQKGDVFEDTVLIAPDIVSGDAKQVELFFDDAITKGLEGVIAKKKDGIYQPGARGWNWIKFKRSYSSKIEDTIDCLVMGYDWGKGKRAEFGIGAFLVGLYDEDNDIFKTVAKIGTGLTDEEWRELKRLCDEQITDSKPALYEVDKQMAVDVWVAPFLVVEIKADEITRSPVHTAGRIMKASKSGNALEVDVPGYALRFPRLKHFRYDKRPQDVTTLKEIEAIKK
ncbi:ATP-dependent DNA ligase [Candidatus Roizmanbacteria bacterium]|nr:ATP-dependent DNA ligase [Candidatus Roizmanbacteria bacterium]